MSLKLSAALANAEAEAAAELFDSGQMLVYDGTRPASADAPVNGQTLLLRFQFGNPAFQRPRDGLLISNHVNPELSAPASGTATWYRVVSKDGLPLLDGTVGKEGSGANLIFSNPEIRQGQEMHLTSFTHDIKGKDE